MPQPMRWEAISRFLDGMSQPDLAGMYSREMECQVNVARDGGERVGDYKGWRGCTWTDGIDQWYPIRIPKSAATSPEDNSEIKMTYDLQQHAEGIGMTGWNWSRKVSLWVAYDFDALLGHSDRHTKKLTDQEMDEVRARACAIPWVTVRKSSSGKGLHLYVFLGPKGVETANHHEHAALARAILGIMSAEAGFDFCSRVDICGGNMWVWHRKCQGNDGFELIRQGDFLLEIPPNWRDHVKVIKGIRKKNLPNFVEDSLEDLFDQMCGQRPRARIDKEHRRFIDWLKENNAQAWWDADHHMLVTHTWHLMQAHEALNLRGVFDTAAKGSEAPNDHNCFMFPMRRGEWAVRRFSPGCTEVASWEQDGQGWTRCYFNKNPDLKTAARSLGAIENEKGGFVFQNADQALQVTKLLGADVQLPPWATIRPATLRQHKDGRLIFEMEYTQHDPGVEMKGWLQDRKKWKRIFGVKTSSSNQEIDAGIHDDVLRHLTTVGSDNAGWVVRVEGRWVTEPIAHIKAALRAMGFKSAELDPVIGSNIFRPWTLVNYPFQPEYPGDRKWNRDAAQLAFLPSEEPGEFPHWRMILRHIGQSLTEALVDNENGWFKVNDIKTGEDYLMLWIASMFQCPERQLPYLFLYDPAQNTGKSILHEAIGLLMTKGVKRVDNALRKDEKFNAELEGAILCVIEESDFSKNKGAYNKIKDWVTSLMLSIHRKGITPYEIINTCHFIHCSNSFSAVPIFGKDTRITMINVRPLDPVNMVPKNDLMTLLRKEAPFFLNHVLNLELPTSNDRLNVPVLDTDEKAALAKSNQSALETFIEEMCYYAPGQVVPFGTFWMKFQDWCEGGEAENWTKIRVSKNLPPQFPSGNPHGSSMRHIGNISFDKPPPGGVKLRRVGTRLV